jgi:dTDP-4-amino-4,6-dideoxygalactose transaminase
MGNAAVRIVNGEAERSVPFFNYPALYGYDPKGIMGVIEGVLRRGAFILQRDLTEFEDALKSFLGVRHVFGVADGTKALIIGLRAIGIGAGDEIILPSHTYIASAASIHFAGAKPVPVEIGPDHMLSADAVERAITPRTKAIMAVQLNGRTCDMDALGRIAAKHKLILVEDAAQALGSRFKGKSAGTFGAFGTFSFYPAKVLGCFGDGGAVVTNDDAVAEQIGLLRDHGRNQDGKVVAWGTNSRLDNMQAAVLLHKLKTFAGEIERRRDIARMYDNLLGDVSELVLPPAPGAGDHFDIYQNYELEVEDRDALKDHLKARGVGTLIQWGGTPVHQHRELGFDCDLPMTDRFFTRCLMLPMNTALDTEDVLHVIDTVRGFYGRQSVS